ncbi:alpha/beta-hydrolase [Rickenella mellea]|uniref:Carboxylic ester hydrolase n=1 Tax=Rickenella mellea TaxID=50990 RepID=A0A4Y7PYB4_9AGAM|nr:alpha/beta-hydrolase [Rickenella mellea]
MLFVFAFFALALSQPSTAMDPTHTATHVIDTGYAKYLGNFTAPFSVGYLGVPYAEPPVGDLRFRAPVPLDTQKLRDNKHLVNATSYPNFCVQGSLGGGVAGGAGTEDCLKVNIYAPVNSTSKSKLPVLVYIHGGGFLIGNPRVWPFEYWINQSPNVVIVSVYYRLDSFGFLAHPSFRDGSVGDLNAGFLDQTEALRWVKRYIAAFGGDPGQVTINGQSAGASSVELHLVANEGQSLFSGAIAQSVYRGPIPSPEQQVPLFNFVAQQAGCNVSAQISTVLACLRKAPISALAQAQDLAGSETANPIFNRYNIFQPVIDGKIFTEHPTDLLVQGKFARVPIMAGSTSNETVGGSDVQSILTFYFPQLTARDLTEFNKIYIPSDFSSEQQRVNTASGEAIFRCGREILGNAGRKFTKAWTYRYNQPNPTLAPPGDTEHAAENWMMFLGSNFGPNGTGVFTGLNNVETAFSQELIGYWLSFVRASDPNRFKLARSPIWPDFSTGQRLVLQEDPQNTSTTSGVFIEAEPVKESSRCAFIASKSTRMQN